MVTDPFKEWYRMDTFSALLVDLGGKPLMSVVEI